MAAMMNWIERMNILLWSLAIFGAHLVMYFILGTENWYFVALEAAVVWAVALLFLKAIAKAVTKGERAR